MGHPKASLAPRENRAAEHEVAHELPKIGRRAVLLNACQLFREGESPTTLLLGIEDVTEKLESCGANYKADI